MSVPDDNLSPSMAPYRPFHYGDPQPPMLYVYEEPFIERRAWELFRDAMRDGLLIDQALRDAFDQAEAFAAEAAKRRDAK